jgi:hypothetical protein
MSISKEILKDLEDLEQALREQSKEALEKNATSPLFVTRDMLEAICICSLSAADNIRKIRHKHEGR